MSKLGAFDGSGLGAFIQSDLLVRGESRAAVVLFSAKVDRVRNTIGRSHQCVESTCWEVGAGIYLHGDRVSDFEYSPGVFHYLEIFKSGSKIAHLFEDMEMLASYNASTSVSPFGSFPVVDTPDGYTTAFVGRENCPTTPASFSYWDIPDTIRIVHRITGSVLFEYSLPVLLSSNKIFCVPLTTFQHKQTDSYQGV